MAVIPAKNVPVHFVSGVCYQLTLFRTLCGLYNTVLLCYEKEKGEVFSSPKHFLSSAAPSYIQ